MKNSISSINLHEKLKGKLSINSKIPINNKKILALLYTPGVAEAVNKIRNSPESVYNLTIKNNTVAVVTDGSAVLGMGNVGAQAAIPVMEGKCAIFKEFAGINAFPVCLDSQNTKDIISAIKIISPVFGAINLEDIASPRCFEIEEKLRYELTIPVMHDDQHATAIIVLAGLMNACKIIGKELTHCKIVVNGVGAAGTAVLKLLNNYNMPNLTAVDSNGIIHRSRPGLDKYKKEISTFTNKPQIRGSLETAVLGADILIGLSKKGLFTKKIISLMTFPNVVFALANPDPELTETDAKKWGISVYANGRSDCQNQINNALVFPGFFKGLLTNRKINITDELKLKVSRVIASIIEKPASKYFIPAIFDKRLVVEIIKCFN